MFLSHTSEYALRIVSFMTLNKENARLNAKAISKGTRVPPHYCSKILRKLVEAQILQAERGKSGGFILAKSPALIRFCDVFEAIHFELDPKHCVFGLKKCNSLKPCILHHRWQNFKEVFRHWAETNTLENIIKDNGLTMPQTFLTSKESKPGLKISETDLKSRFEE